MYQGLQFSSISSFPLHDERQLHTQNYLDSLGGSAHDMTTGGSTGLKYVNSERDLSLPLEKHKTLDNYYDSQEDGKIQFLKKISITY